MPRLRALFVAYGNALSGQAGGAQVCTNEFIRCIAGAGIELEICSVEVDRRFSTRLLRPLNRSKYFRPVRPNDLKVIAEKSASTDLIFLNQVGLAGIAPAIKELPSPPKIVTLSHGCEITDLVHMARLASKLPISTRELWPHRALALSRTFLDEIRFRSAVDGCVCISEPDALTERWLGTPQVLSIPRTIDPKPLKRDVEMGHFGYVGTLDHAPNLEGLVEVLGELARRQAADMRVRIVGNPSRIGNWLASRFPNADYLGPLSVSELDEEASTWAGFLHPIFCQPRGCSTKLATALEWQIPVITTPEGRRGYTWREGSVLEALSVGAFVDAMEATNSNSGQLAAFEAVRLAAESCPSENEVGIQIMEFVMQVLSA